MSCLSYIKARRGDAAIDAVLTEFRILPSTLILVMCALEVVEWAA